MFACVHDTEYNQSLLDSSHAFDFSRHMVLLSIIDKLFKSFKPCKFYFLKLDLI